MVVNSGKVCKLQRLYTTSCSNHISVTSCNMHRFKDIIICELRCYVTASNLTPLTVKMDMHALFIAKLALQ